jgi:hypothetical protein
MIYKLKFFHFYCKAAAYGHLKIVEFLLEKNSFLKDQKTNEGYTALHYGI